MICTDYEPAYVARGGSRGPDRRTRAAIRICYRYGADVDENFIVAQFDFFTEAGRGRTAGCSTRRSPTATTAGWRTSASTRRSTRSPIPAAGGSRAPTRTTSIATRYHCAAYLRTVAAERPIVRFQRSGWTGAAPCAQVVWGGDPTTGFGFDGLRSAVTQALSAGTSGIGIWGSDIGGFFALGERSLSPELLDPLGAARARSRR